MLVDANVLLYAVDDASPFNAAARTLRGNMVADADLAAVAIEHGLAICSADTDFARFREVRWVNPIAPDAARGLR